jgi:hypothetical protein
MGQLGLSPATKEIGLREFYERGWVLVDATHKAVDELKEAGRNLEDLAALTADRFVPLILIKPKVCRTLEPLLSKEGFNVLNNVPAACYTRQYRRRVWRPPPARLAIILRTLLGGSGSVRAYVWPVYLRAINIRNGSSLGRSRADDPDAPCRLLLRPSP